MSAVPTMDWPWQYSFPPFFSLQPHSATRSKQLEAWRHLVLNYCQASNLSTLDLAEAGDLDLFHNSAISRRLSEEGIMQVLEELAERGNLEWTDKTRRRALVFWKSPAQLGQEIYRWVTDSGQVGTVLTLAEIMEEGENNAWKGVSQEILVKALRILEGERKCEVFQDLDGVKFF